VAKLQAASVPIAQGSCAVGQTDGRIAVSLNAPPPYGGGRITFITRCKVSTQIMHRTAAVSQQVHE